MPATELRQSVLPNAQRVVIKIGTQLLTTTTPTTTATPKSTSTPATASTSGKPKSSSNKPPKPASRTGLDTRFIGRMASQIAALHQSGIQVTLVSSGAIGAGCVELGLEQKPADVAAQQAVAAVGQRRLMAHWHDAFKRRGLSIGQLLLTRNDFDDRTRFLNIRNCVNSMHRMGVIPVLNENDTVAVEELRFGDNDQLAALMANAVCAQAMILLTVVDGLLDEDGTRVPCVDNVQDFMQLTTNNTHGTKSTWGTGGMASKLQSVRRVTDAGDIAVIANGRKPHVIDQIMAGQDIGTVFLPAQRKLDSRARWIGLTARPAGTVSVDAGAADALFKRGKSLLPSGVTGSTGQFDPGDVLLVRDPAGKEVARGLSNYSDQELRLIAGKRSDQFHKLLGRASYAELIHRDNLVLRNDN